MPEDIRTAILHDPIFSKHDPGQGHPEQVARNAAVVGALERAGILEGTLAIQPRAATVDEIERVHPAAYRMLAEREIAAGQGDLSTGDTQVSEHSYDVAAHAAGGLIKAVDGVFGGKAKNAFCVVRPPGHHACPEKGMGFCVFNSVAIAARAAQADHGIERVAIVDWDVHHGNGTQDVFYEDGSVFFFSSHQSPWYPGTGAVGETGDGAGVGTTMNRPFAAGSGMAEIGASFRDELVPALDVFQPELVLISAGFDSRIGDPLGHFKLTDDDFAELTKLMMDVADRHCDGRVVSVLEGGYNLEGLGLAAAAHAGELAKV